MNIKEIPKILFDEFSKKFGIGEEKKIGVFLIKELDSGGVIGFRQSIGSDKAFLTVWPYFNERIINSYFGYWLEISAGPVREGVWAYGIGQLMKETLTAEFPVRGIDLNSPIASILVMIFARATALTQSPILPKEQFWEVQCCPNGNYKKP